MSGNGRLVYRISSLLDLADDHEIPLSGGLYLLWRPYQPAAETADPDATDYHRLLIARKGQRPSPQEDLAVHGALLTAARARQRVAVGLSMTPGVEKKGWGATEFRFKLAEQRPLL
jgi:hypothetical protein